MGLRLSAALAAALSVIGALLVAVAGPASADVADVAGSASGLSADIQPAVGAPITFGPEPHVDLPAGGGDVSDDATGLDVPGLIDAGTAEVHTEGSNGPTGGVVSTSTVEGLSVLPAVLLQADAVQASCNAGFGSPQGTTTVAGLDVVGEDPVPPNPAPNTEIPLGVGTLTLNAQEVVGGQITVTGLSLDVNVPAVFSGTIDVASVTCSTTGDGTGEPPGPDDPTVIEVTTTDDVIQPLDGETSLREAVTAATLSLIDGATIVLDEGATYDLTTCNLGDVLEEDLNLTGDLDFLGATQELLGGGPFVVEGHGSTINQTCPGDRIFELFGLGDMELHDLTLTGGDHPGNGGAVSRNLAGVGQGSLLIEGSNVQGNSAGLAGGGAYSDDALDCETSTFTENSAGTNGGAMFAGGSLDVNRCTIDRNRADGNGGGLAGDNLLADVSMTIADSTLTANRAEGGGGANVDTDGGLDTDGSVIALSSEPGDGNGDDCVVGGTATSAGDNLGGNDCGFGAGDVLGDHPNLMPLTDNGGFTETKAPVMDSDVVDFYEGCEGTEQRGEPVPAGDGCDIGAIDEPPPVCAVEFPDVPADHPFFAEVCWMAQMGITTGYIDGSFNPAGNITRQSMAAFTFRVSGSPLFPLPAEEAFPDVPAGFVFRPDIEWMADEDITRGYADGTFKPVAPVTRQAMAAFMYRLASEPEFVVPAQPTYSDYETDHPFFTEIEWLAQAGITTGYEDGEFKPEQAISRQAMAAFLYRLAQTPEVWG